MNTLNSFPTSAMQPSQPEMTLEELDTISGGVSFVLNRPDLKLNKPEISLVPKSYSFEKLYFPGEML